MGDVVSMSNHLIRAGFSLSEWEMRVISAAASQIRMGQSITPDDWFILSADTSIDLFDVPRGSVYQKLKAVADKLYDRSISYKYTPDGLPHIEREGRRRWVSEVEYRKGEGEIALKFSASVIPYLVELQGQFTQYTVSEIGKVKSAHGQRLLQLLMQFRSTGYMVMKTDELRFSMDVIDRHPETRQFTSRVIKTAAEAIQKALPDIDLKWKTTKKGRVIDGYAFTFNPNKAKSSHKFEVLEDEAEVVRKREPKGVSPQEKRLQDRDSVRKNIMDINNTDW